MAKGESTKTPRRRRGSLQPDDIVSAAATVVAEHGIEALTMPAVAEALDAAVTSVYWHFRSRDALVAAVARRVTTDLYAVLPPVAHAASWEDEILNYCIGLREALLAHPAFLELFSSRSAMLYADPTIGRLVNQRLERELEVLLSAGASAEDAYRFYSILSVYTRGFVALELGSIREHPTPDVTQTIVGRQASLDPVEYPVISAIPNMLSLTWGDADRHFMDGLRLLINGIKVELSLPDRVPAARTRRR